MLAVIEINKVRQVVDLDPANGPLRLHRLFELFNFDGLLFHDAVAIHADAGRGDAGMAAGARGVMTVETGNLVVARVDLVGKSDGLRRRISLMDADAGELPCSGRARDGHPRNTHQ